MNWDNVSDDVRRLNPELFGDKNVPKKKNKYNASSRVVDGIKFASTREAKRYEQLKILERIGNITGLTLQPKFTLMEGFVAYDGKRIRPITYKADFMYVENGVTIIEEVKGFVTRDFNLRKKLFIKKITDGDLGDKVRYIITR